MKSKVAAAACAAAMTLATAGAAHAAEEPDVAYKNAHQKDPDSLIVGPPIATSAAERAQDQQKLLAAQLGTAKRPPGLSTQSTAPSATAAATSSRYLGTTQRAQQTSYWCGPAAVQSALLLWGRSYAQSTLASQLRTTTNGTAWSGVWVSTSPSTGRPVPDVLNNRIGSSYYVPVNVPNGPSSTDKSNYRSRLVAAIYTYATPIVAGAWEVPGGPHLVGHPSTRDIKHYISVRGYSNSGATTAYQDSASGASSISWSGSVPAYANYTSDTLVRIFGGYGYVW